MYLAIVTHPIPPGAKDVEMTDLIRKTAPNYCHIPGLQRKYFMGNAALAGGVYEFESEEAARQYFDAAWLARMKNTYGVVVEVAFFAAPAFVDVKSKMLHLQAVTEKIST